jgi:hypothetical protein
MLRALSFLLLISFFPHQSNAQQDFSFTNQVIVNSQPSQQNNVIEILKIISSGNGKTLRNTIYTVVAEQNLNANKQSGNYTFLIRNKPLTLQGDITYRGFNITESLAPFSVSYTLKITATGFQKEFPLTAEVVNLKPKETTVNLRDTNNRVFNYAIINYKLNYTNDNLRAVQQKAGQIDNYFNKTAFLDQNFALLQLIDPYDYAGYRTLMARLDRAQKAYDDVNNAHVLSGMNAGNYDPARLNEKLIAYNGLLQNKRTDAIRVFSTLHQVFYSRGNDAMRDGNNTAAYDLYHASLEVNPAFAPSMLQLARIDFIRGDLKESQCKSDEILFRMLPDPATRSNTIDLLRNIKDSYIDMGLSSIGYKKFNQALNEFALAQDICSRYPEIRCNDEVKQGIEKAHKGIYNDYLQNARFSLAKGDLTSAEKDANEAIRYHNSKLAYLGEPTEALAFQKTLRQKKYDNMIVAANQLSDRGDYQNAVMNFTEADNLREQYGLQQATDFEKSSKPAAGKYITQLLEKSENAVKLNNIPQAKSALQEVIDVQNRFYLSADKTISKKVNDLRSKIYTQECINAQYSVDSCVIAGRVLEHDRNFLQAMLVLEKGMEVKNTYSDCKLFTDSLESLLYRVRPAGTYLQLIDNSGTEIQNGNYRDAMKLYNDASTYFTQQNLGAFGLQHNSDRDDYVLKTGNNGLLNYCAQNDMYEGQLENSLRLYKLLLDRDYNADFLSDSLYELGKRTGAADYKSAPGGKARKLAARHTGDDKRLKRFAKGYVKGYR